MVQTIPISRKCVRVLSENDIVSRSCSKKRLKDDASFMEKTRNGRLMVDSLAASAAALAASLTGYWAASGKVVASRNAKS
ncbi:hypothetical protein HZH68_010667 [Vespula germanica]|uniref:Uncharacterized protein n=1 Tax=Vespula germanica TaxID=30212 RepID=A0A834JSA2_VESGE|nr:hypothetical protein HZH68_010667 [Vespula germanica]